MPRLDGLKFHPAKPGSCNHHLRSSKTAFCVQPRRKVKLSPSTKPGPKYSCNRRNIALVQFIQDFLYRDKNKDKMSVRN